MKRLSILSIFLLVVFVFGMGTSALAVGDVKKAPVKAVVKKVVKKTVAKKAVVKKAVKKKVKKAVKKVVAPVKKAVVKKVEEKKNGNDGMKKVAPTPEEKKEEAPLYPTMDKAVEDTATAGYTY